MVCVSDAASLQRQCSTLSNDRKFLLDMLYSRTSAAVPPSPTAATPDTTEEEVSFVSGESEASVSGVSNQSVNDLIETD